MENQNLSSTFYIDFEAEIVQDFIKNNSNPAHTKAEQAVELYYAVRDLIRYDPYTYSFDKENFKASNVILSKRAWCVPKAILYAACCRAIGVSARLGFADVRNHLSTERMRKRMKTDIFHWHGYVSVFLYGKWVKATPAFNIELCTKFGLKPLDFDGKNDSIYHPFDLQGNQHMEYLKDRGTFDDFPFREMVTDLGQLYGDQRMEEMLDFDKDVEREIAIMKELAVKN